MEIMLICAIGTAGVNVQMDALSEDWQQPAKLLILQRWLGSLTPQWHVTEFSKGISLNGLILLSAFMFLLK